MNNFFVTTLLAFVLLNLVGAASADQDWEYWSKYSLQMAGGGKFGFSLKPEFRFRNSFEDYYYSKTYIGLFCKLSPFVKIEGYYAYKRKEAATGWKQTDLLYLDPTLKFDLRYLVLSSRFRFEYDLEEEELVYRNGLKLGRSFCKNLTVFIKEEPFYSFQSGRFEENRLSVGSSVKVLSKAAFAAEYILNSKKVNSGWKAANVIVTSLSFLF